MSSQRDQPCPHLDTCFTTLRNVTKHTCLSAADHRVDGPKGQSPPPVRDVLVTTSLVESVLHGPLGEARLH